MEAVSRIDQKLRRLNKPCLMKSSGLDIGPGDGLVFCAGFEDRAARVPQLLLKACTDGVAVVKIGYLPNLPQNAAGAVSALEQLNSVCSDSLVYDRERPAGMGERVAEAVANVDGRLFIDVSAMSRLLIVQLITSLADSPRGIKQTSVLYVEAVTYPPDESSVTKKEFTIYDTMFLSRGVSGVAIVPELSSVALQGQPVRLVAFPSFNIDQLSALRMEIQPSTITLVHGVPPSRENGWRPGAIRKLNNTESLPSREDKTASTLDYRETLECLLDIYDDYSALERIVVAPTGSKMQAVAVGILRSFMRDIQIAYPTPREFAPPDRYTTGCKCLYRLDLDVFSELLSQTNRFETGDQELD